MASSSTLPGRPLSRSHPIATATAAAASHKAGLEHFTGDSSLCGLQVQGCRVLEATHVLAGGSRPVDLTGPEPDVEDIELRPAALRPRHVLFDVLGFEQLGRD